MTIKSYRDITTNIPNMFLGSGAPTAPPRIIFLIFQDSITAPEHLNERPAWAAEMSPNLEFPRIFGQPSWIHGPSRSAPGRSARNWRNQKKCCQEAP